MFPQASPRTWLLIALAIAAYAPTSYIYRYRRFKPPPKRFGRDVDAPEWRIWRQYNRCLVALAAIGALAVFIYTSAAEKFARSPSFMPILMVAAGTFALFTLFRGSLTGSIQPFVRGFHRTYRKTSEPKRYWASMGWNAVFGLMCLWIATKTNEQTATQLLQDRCYDTATITYPPHEKLSACDKLIAMRGKSDDDLASLIEARGTARYRLNDFRGAMADYTDAIRLDPKEPTSRFNRGLVDEQFGDRRAAFADYGAAIRLQADNADAYLNRALLSLDDNRLDQAISDLTRVLELRPKDVAASANRGLAYAWKDDPDKAKQGFAVARAADPSNPVLLRGEALLADDAGDLDTALKRLDDQLTRDPNDMWSLNMRAKVFRQLGDTNKAQADLDRLRQLRKQVPSTVSAA